MSNCFDLTCPKCGSSKIDIEAKVWVRLCEDGTNEVEAYDEGHTWDDDCRFYCIDCEHEGRVGTLKEGDG